MTTLYQQIEQAPRHQVNRILHHLMYVNPEAFRFMDATLNQQPIDATGDPADDPEYLGMIDDDLADIPFLDDEPDEASYVTGWIDGREGYV